MAKTQAITTLSPNEISLGAGVYYEDALAVSQLLNEISGKRPRTHVSLVVAPHSWATHALYTHGVRFIVGAGMTEVMRFRIRIEPETVNVICGARCYFATSNTGSVRITVGSANTTLTFANSDNANEKTGTLATSSTGTGWQTVTVEVQQTAGSTAGTVRNLRIADQKITSSLPDPGND